MVPNRSVVEDQELQILRSTATEVLPSVKPNGIQHPGEQGAPVMCPADLAPSVLKAAKSLPTSQGGKQVENHLQIAHGLLFFQPTNVCML